MRGSEKTGRERAPRRGTLLRLGSLGLALVAGARVPAGAASADGGSHGVPNPAHTVIPASGVPVAPLPTRPAADGTYHLSLAQLGSFDYQMPSSADLERTSGDPKGLTDQIPSALRALDGKRVSIDGFILEMDFDDRQIRRFLLSPSVPGCCWGGPTKMNDWVDVSVPSRSLAARLATMDDTAPITAVGRLAVGEMIEGGFLVSLYRMVADQVGPRVAGSRS